MLKLSSVGLTWASVRIRVRAAWDAKKAGVAEIGLLLKGIPN